MADTEHQGVELGLGQDRSGAVELDDQDLGPASLALLDGPLEEIGHHRVEVAGDLHDVDERAGVGAVLRSGGGSPRRQSDEGQAEQAD